MGDHLHLGNQNFTSSLSSSLWSLVRSSLLCDCTLVCSDGHLSAHRVILAASSSFFRAVFSSNQHSSTLIYLKGVRKEQVEAVLDFMYKGGTQLSQKDLPSFLQLAEDLKIDGLVRHCEKGEKNIPESPNLMDFIKSETNEIMGSAKKEIRVDSTNTSRKRKISCTQVSQDSDSFDNKNEEVGNINILESSTFTINTITTQDTMGKKASDNDDDKGIDPCIENDVKLIQAKSKSKLDNVLEDVNVGKMFPRLFPKVFCPVCKKMDGMSIDLKQHMKAKREVQCENCMLYFSNCNTLRVHLDGRCKLTKKQMN